MENPTELLIRLDEKVDMLLKWQGDHLQFHEKSEAEIKKLQEWRWREAGALGVLIFLIDWVKGWFTGRN